MLAQRFDFGQSGVDVVGVHLPCTWHHDGGIAHAVACDHHAVLHVHAAKHVVVERVVFVAVQRVGPVIGFCHIERVCHTHGTGLQRCADICLAQCGKLQQRVAHQSGEDGGEPFGEDGSSGCLVADIDGEVHHRLPSLQQLLRLGDVAREGGHLRPPRVVTLEEGAYAVERHPRLAVGPGVVGVHVEDDAVHTEAPVAVEQRLEDGRRLIPGAAHLCEPLRLHHVLAVDVCAADGVEHVVGLVVGG